MTTEKKTTVLRERMREDLRLKKLLAPDRKDLYRTRWLVRCVL
jgi:hypothetical protein